MAPTTGARRARWSTAARPTARTGTTSRSTRARRCGSSSTTPAVGWAAARSPSPSYASPDPASGRTLAGMAAVTPSPSAAGTGRARAAVRTAVVWDYLRAGLDELDEGRPLHVLDVGGGSGGFAVPVAQLGHTVTVVDPSPDSLAALERRAAETGTTDRVRGLQGDAAGLPGLVPAGSFDLVLCHSVLEVVDDPQEALQAIAAAVRPGGVASVLAANRIAAVFARATAGRLGEARRLFTDPSGSAGPGDPLARRFG